MREMLHVEISDSGAEKDQSASERQKSWRTRRQRVDRCERQVTAKGAGSFWRSRMSAVSARRGAAGFWEGLVDLTGFVNEDDCDQ